MPTLILPGGATIWHNEEDVGGKKEGKEERVEPLSNCQAEMGKNLHEETFLYRPGAVTFSQSPKRMTEIFVIIRLRLH